MTQSMSYYQGGFAGGLNVRGVPLIQTHPGRVFWVSNNTTNLETNVKPGSNGNDGQYNAPFSTIDFAIGMCKAGRGDIILVKPNHSESITGAATIAMDVAGIAIVGLGHGDSRPTLTWTTAASTVTVAASNMVIQNFLFLGNMASTFTVTAFSNANAVIANNFQIDNCEFSDQDATHGFIACFTGGTTANQSDGLRFTNNKVFRNLTSPPAANTAVVIGAAIKRMVFTDNFIVNKTVNNNIALGFALGANAVQALECGRNRTQSQNTGTTAGELFSGGSTTSTGLVYDNYSSHLAATGLIMPVLTKIGVIQNFCHVTGAVDKSALINPTAV